MPPTAPSQLTSGDSGLPPDLVHTAQTPLPSNSQTCPTSHVQSPKDSGEGEAALSAPPTQFFKATTECLNLPSGGGAPNRDRPDPRRAARGWQAPGWVSPA